MKFSVVGASLLVFAWASLDVLSAAFAEGKPAGLESSKYVECVVEVSGGEFEALTILDQQKIELKLQADYSWLGTGELQIDPRTKHGFKLRKTNSPGIDLITSLRNGIEFGFFGIEKVEINFERSGYATHIYCTDVEAPAPGLKVSRLY
jgi:hypothetical protein